MIAKKDFDKNINNEFVRPDSIIEFKVGTGTDAEEFIFFGESNVPKNDFLNFDSNSVDYSYVNNTITLDNVDLSETSENVLNLNRKDTLDNQVTEKFLKAVDEEEFDFGYISISEQIIKEQLSINGLATRNWLNELFIDYFADDKILIGILRLLGRFNEKEIFPQGQTMALAALNHENTEIKELGIRAFESWPSKSSLRILKKVNTEIPWLKEYVDEVIIDIKEDLCI